MPDICVLCTKDDVSIVSRLVAELKANWDVWWYKDISDGNWDEQTEKAILESKCVVPVWSKASIRHGSKVSNEAYWAEKKGIAVVPVNIDDVDLPLLFSRTSSINLNDWNGEIPHDGVLELVNKLNIVLKGSKRQGRPYEILLNGVAVKLPCFARSISSHETQLQPDIALKAMELLQIDDAILFSAYDMYLPKNADNEEVKLFKKKIKNIEKIKKKGCLVLMDSGKYEASRKGELELTSKQKKKNIKQKVKKEYLWTEKKFNVVCKNTPYTYAFCFDDIYPPNSVNKIVNDVSSRVTKKNDLIPIVHAHEKANGDRDSSKLPEIFYLLSKKIRPSIIAVPERELGQGIIERAKAIISIRKKLNSLSYYQPIHVLGTGNPITIAILAAAGADLFDGLEWCRTVADRENGQLYHHQHIEFFIDETINNSLSPFVKAMLLDDSASPAFKLAGHNLDFMTEFMRELRDNMKINAIEPFLKYYLPHIGMEIIKKQLPEIFE